MSIQDIREMEDGVIHEEIVNLEKEIMHLRMGNVIGSVDNPIQIRQKKRDVARMKTVLRERALKQG